MIHYPQSLCVKITDSCYDHKFSSNTELAGEKALFFSALALVRMPFSSNLTFQKKLWSCVGERVKHENKICFTSIQRDLQIGVRVEVLSFEQAYFEKFRSPKLKRCRSCTPI